jgi:hypothetical protein
VRNPPLRAISIRQPYAELIVQGVKDVENRSWSTKHRGPLLIHASAQVDAWAMQHHGFGGAALPRGALVGAVDLVDCTHERGSEWHVPGQQGWYLAAPRRFSRPVPFTGNVGLLNVPASRVRRAMRGARRPNPADLLTVFSFGYWGWGGETEALVVAADAVERARGFGPPIFVDIRLSRSVRAEGFRDDAFERLVGFDGYRWMRTLGNRSIKTGENRIRIAAPEAAEQLLDLALDARRDRRRVIFFCACEVPRVCHRRAVGHLLLRVAARRGLPINVTEWPGTVASALVERDLSVTAQTYDSLLGGSVWIPLPRSITAAEAGSLAYGSVVRVRSRGRPDALVAIGRVQARLGRWETESIFADVESAQWDAVEAARAGRHERHRAGHAALV